MARPERRIVASYADRTARAARTHAHSVHILREILYVSIGIRIFHPRLRAIIPSSLQIVRASNLALLRSPRASRWPARQMHPANRIVEYDASFLKSCERSNYLWSAIHDSLALASADVTDSNFAVFRVG